MTFSEGEPPQSLAALRSGDCDVAVAFTYPGTGAGRDVDDLAGLLTVPLLDDELHVVLPRSHPLADREHVALVPGLVLRTTTHQAVVTRPLHPTSLRSVLAVTTPDLRRVPAVDALIGSLQRAAR